LFTVLDDTWHRFFLDAGLLFWREGHGLAPVNDLGDGDTYRDLGAELGVCGSRLRELRFDAGTLIVQFDNGAVVEPHTDEGSDGSHGPARSGLAQP